MVLLSLLACHHLGTVPEHDATGGVGVERIEVTPDELLFPTISVNHEDPAVLSFEITNLGDGTVTVTGHDEVGRDTPFTVDADPLLSIPAGEKREVPVRFAPTTDGSWSADLLIQPGDEALHLEGAATAPVVSPGAVSFDAVVLGCTGRGTVTVRNRGSEALELRDARLGSAEFAVVGLPDEISPGGSDTVDLTFTPAGSGSRTTSLVLGTNDPATPEVSVSVSALGYEGEHATETFHYAPSNPTDILFVVDTGVSMAEHLAPATAAIATFVGAIRTTNVDYHLTALGSEIACPGTTPGFATRSDTSLQTEVVVEQGFQAGAGPWEDDLLGLALTGLDASTVGGCLEGFRRPTADLHVIAVTDGPAGADLDDQVRTLAGRAEGDAGFRLSAMLPLSGCGADADAWSDEVETTGGTAGDLCGTDWSAAFTTFASLPPGADPVTYPLAEQPVPSSVEVWVEGAPFASWSYDTAENAVVFDGDAIPALGAEVAVSYVLAVACEG